MHIFYFNDYENRLKEEDDETETQKRILRSARDEMSWLRWLSEAKIRGEWKKDRRRESEERRVENR